MKDLRLLPKLRDGLTYLYVEHCRVEQDAKAIAIYDTHGKTPVPCAALSVLMLGPGTNITHAAVRVLAECGCLVLWVGEEGIRFYAQGMGESRSAANLIKQSILCSVPSLRLKVVRRLYQMRFPEALPDDLTLQQVRGREGIRVREAYAQASRETGVQWMGRNYNRDKWSNSDPINRALSCANATLYGICHAAIVSLGFSPGLGFIHTGKQLSFVYDIADLYKVDVSIPVAFKAVASGDKNLERTVRQTCRDFFKEHRLLARIAEDLNALFDFPEVRDVEALYEADSDAAHPGYLWGVKGEKVAGGANYAAVSKEDHESW